MYVFNLCVWHFICRVDGCQLIWCWKSIVYNWLDEKATDRLHISQNYFYEDIWMNKTKIKTYSWINCKKYVMITSFEKGAKKFLQVEINFKIFSTIRWFYSQYFRLLFFKLTAPFDINFLRIFIWLILFLNLNFSKIIQYEKWKNVNGKM